MRETTTSPPLPSSQPELGAVADEHGTRFRVWAPGWRSVELMLDGGGARPLALTVEGGGWHSAAVSLATPGTRYRYLLDGAEAFPDPLSRYQPEGVHGPSEVVDPGRFRWSDSTWKGIRIDGSILYEVHVGTATEEGTFDGLGARLDILADLGITAIELMPVGQFPGRHNWGYDGAYWFAPARSYGGPEGLRRLVDAAHARGIGVILDVVYNHLGPEGSYLAPFSRGRVFSDRHHTAWGAAINYDGEGSDGVREIVVGNAVHWIREYHIDGLRLDATHAIVDDSSHHVLREITERVRASTDRSVVLIAEDDRNQRRLILDASEGGMGLDAVWADDLHHHLRRRTAGDTDGYYRAYSGSVDDIVRTLRSGWFFQGEVYPPTGRRRGTPASDLPPSAFVHCLQNHDQVGNRATGERLNHEISPAVYRALSTLLLTSPYTPLLWMGQEWAASTPFLYFTDHPEELGRLVTEGRRSEFGAFDRFSDPMQREAIPDPQSAATFERSRLRWSEMAEEPHAGIRALYRELISMRRAEPALRSQDRTSFAVTSVGSDGFALRRESEDATLLTFVNLGKEVTCDLRERPETRPPAGTAWELLLASEETRFGGTGQWGSLLGSALSFRAPAAVVLRTEHLP